jgi:hypothetical protein
MTKKQRRNHSPAFKIPWGRWIAAGALADDELHLDYPFTGSRRLETWSAREWMKGHFHVKRSTRFALAPA